MSTQYEGSGKEHIWALRNQNS